MAGIQSNSPFFTCMLLIFESFNICFQQFRTFSFIKHPCRLSQCFHRCFPVQHWQLEQLTSVLFLQHNVKLENWSKFKLTPPFFLFIQSFLINLFLDPVHRWPQKELHQPNWTQKGRSASQRWPFRGHQEALGEDTTKTATAISALLMDANDHCGGSYTVLLFQQQSRLEKLPTLLTFSYSLPSHATFFQKVIFSLDYFSKLFHCMTP